MSSIFENIQPETPVETVVVGCLDCGLTHRVKVWIPEEYGDWCKVEDWTYDPDDGAFVYQHFCDRWEDALRAFTHEVEMWRLKLKGFAEHIVVKPALTDFMESAQVRRLDNRGE